ncbi:hypothetical protein EGT07_16465 [Herbaspirillum sp. HC18]|nr:hypothetical protein EGT07_16465 [Herbaspirillum sp. HC18]
MTMSQERGCAAAEWLAAGKAPFYPMPLCWPGIGRGGKSGITIRKECGISPVELSNDEERAYRADFTSPFAWSCDGGMTIRHCIIFLACLRRRLQPYMV